MDRFSPSFPQMAHWVQAESVFLTKQLSKVHESLEKGVQFLEMSSSTRPTTHVTYKPYRSSNKKKRNPGNSWFTL